MADLLGHPRKNSAPYQVANHSTSNGRLAPNFLLPPDAHNRGFMMDCLSPNGHTVNGINHHPHESECSPVLGHKTAPNSCAIHGLSSSASASRLLNSKVSIACQTVTPLSPPVHLTPPAGFDVDDECISPSSENCDSPMNSWRGTAVDLHHHVHHVQPIHRKKSPQQVFKYFSTDFLESTVADISNDLLKSNSFGFILCSNGCDASTQTIFTTIIIITIPQRCQ